MYSESESWLSVNVVESDLYLKKAVFVFLTLVYSARLSLLDFVLIKVSKEISLGCSFRILITSQINIKRLLS
ncbi:hypothetical protein AB6V60_15890, partial [Klebsiella pneumoniae]